MSETRSRASEHERVVEVGKAHVDQWADRVGRSPRRARVALTRPFEIAQT
jgi:hypothetical protein